ATPEIAPNSSAALRVATPLCAAADRSSSLARSVASFSASWALASSSWSRSFCDFSLSSSSLPSGFAAVFCSSLPDISRFLSVLPATAGIELHLRKSAADDQPSEAASGLAARPYDAIRRRPAPGREFLVARGLDRRVVPRRRPRQQRLFLLLAEQV